MRRLIIIEFHDLQPIRGFLLDYNNKWILIQSNPVDFLVDGYALMRNRKIKKISVDPYTIFIEKGIKVKEKTEKENKVLPLKKLDSMLHTIQMQYGIVSLSTRKKDVIYPGKLRKTTPKNITLTFMRTDGIWGKKRKFAKKNIRIIDFATDYLSTLKRIADRK